MDLKNLKELQKWTIIENDGALGHPRGRAKARTPHSALVHALKAVAIEFLQKNRSIIKYYTPIYRAFL